MASGSLTLYLVALEEFEVKVSALVVAKVEFFGFAELIVHIESCFRVLIFANLLSLHICCPTLQLSFLIPRTLTGEKPMVNLVAREVVRSELASSTLPV